MSMWKFFGKWSMVVIACLWVLLGVTHIVTWAQSHERHAWHLQFGLAYIGLGIAYFVIRIVRRSAF